MALSPAFQSLQTDPADHSGNWQFMTDSPGHQSENVPISHKPRFMTGYQSETGPGLMEPTWAGLTL